MSWNLIPLSALVPVAWRNGGGITRELIAWPNTENWIWRVSVAEVASDGAFSYFAGVQRWLTILTGSGVRLSMGTVVVELTEQSAPLAFDGAASAYCHLLNGPVQDLNLMLRTGPDSVSPRAGNMRRVCGSQRIGCKVAKMIAVYSANFPAVLQFNGTQFTVSKSTLAWQNLPAGAELIVEASDAILMEVALEN